MKHEMYLFQFYFPSQAWIKEGCVKLEAGEKLVTSKIRILINLLMAHQSKEVAEENMDRSKKDRSEEVQIIRGFRPR